MCPCGSGKEYSECCEPLLEGRENAANALAVLRSRYSAYALGYKDYVLKTWHPSTRPEDMMLEPIKWLGLKINDIEEIAEDEAFIDFVARGRDKGLGFRLHEKSRFVKDSDGLWYYVDGDLFEK